MALVIYDHGYRIQTPVRFRQRGVEQLTPSARERALPPNDRRAESPHFEVPPAGADPVVRQAQRAYQQTASLVYPERRRPPLAVGKLMTQPVFTIEPGTPLREAWQQLQEHRVHQLPVVDAEGRLRGMVSDEDLLRATSLLTQTGPVTASTTIEGCYPTQLIVATPDTEARLVALVLLDHHLKAVPVMSAEDELVGIVTRSDLLHLIANDPDPEHWA